MGVAPPPPSMAGSGPPMGRVVEVTGRGGILAASGTTGMAPPGIPGIDGSGSLSGSTAARGRRSKPRSSSSPNKDDPKVWKIKSVEDKWCGRALFVLVWNRDFPFFLDDLLRLSVGLGTTLPVRKTSFSKSCRFACVVPMRFRHGHIISSTYVAIS